MRTLFSLYVMDINTQVPTLIYSNLIITDLSIDAIEKHLELREGFEQHVICGQTLSFWDLYYYAADFQDVINKIESLPIGTAEPKTSRLPVLMRSREIHPEFGDEVEKHSQSFLIYYHRYEIGMSGLAIIEYWMSAHPCAMIFIGGCIFDLVKGLIIKLYKFLFKRQKYDVTNPVVFLRVRRFYKCFEQCTKVKHNDCQIVKISRTKKGTFSIAVRTSNNKLYKVRCNSNGTIIELEQKKDPIMVIPPYAKL